MKKIIFLFFLNTTNLYSATTEIESVIRYRNIGVTYQGHSVYNAHEVSLDINFKTKFDQSSCFVLGGRFVSGKEFHSIYENYQDISTPTIRNFYLDMNCLFQKAKVSVGALKTENVSLTDINRDGWVDGARVQIDLDKIFDALTLEIGHLDFSDSPFVLERINEFSLNYLRVHLKKELTKNIEMSLLHTELNKRSIQQALISLSTKEYLSLFDSISASLALNEGEYGDFSIFASKHYKGLNFIAGFVDEKYDVYESSLFDANGYYLMVTKDLSKKTRLVLLTRKHKKENIIVLSLQHKF